MIDRGGQAHLGQRNRPTMPFGNTRPLSDSPLFQRALTDSESSRRSPHPTSKSSADSEAGPNPGPKPLVPPAVALLLGILAGSPSEIVAPVVRVAALFGFALLPRTLRTARKTSGVGRTGMRPSGAVALLAPFAVGLAVTTSFAAAPGQVGSIDRPDELEPPRALERMGPREITGRVVSTPRRVRSKDHSRRDDSAPQIRFEVRPASGPSTIVFVRGDVRVGRGDLVRVAGQLSSTGRSLRVPHRAAVEIEAQSRSFASIADRSRFEFAHRLDERFDPRVAAWTRALLLGERDGLSPELVDLFRRCGQSHWLAISGLHVGILIALVRAVVRRVTRRPSRAIDAALVAFLAAFSFLAGSDAPVLRAVAVAVAWIGLGSLGRRARTANLIAAAFILTAPFEGTAIFELRYLLSYCAVTAIVIGARPDEAPVLTERARRQRSRAGTLRASLSASFGAQAVLVFVFDEYCPWAGILSIVVAPLFAVTVGGSILALLTCALPFEPSVITPVLDALLGIGFRLIEEVMWRFDALPGTPSPWPRLPALSIALAFVSAVLLFGRFPGFALASSAAAVAVALLTPLPPAGVTTVGLGHGQCVIFRDRGGAVAIDAGSRDRVFGGGPRIAAALRDGGHNGIDVLILTHPHLDHVAAVPWLAGRSRVRHLVVGPRFEARPLGRSVLHIARANGVSVHRVGRGESLDVGIARVEILHPTREPWIEKPSANDDSVVARLTFHGQRWIVPGDLERAGLATVNAPAADVIVLPHHGRGGSPAIEWTLRTGARRSIACGPENRNDPVLPSLRERGMRADRVLQNDLFVPADGDSDLEGGRRSRKRE